MYAGLIEFDVILPDHVNSLKDKRSVVRGVIAELRRHEVAAAQTGHLDLWRRAEIGVGVVAADSAHIRDVLETCERIVVNRPELQVVDVRRRLVGPHDEE